MSTKERPFPFPNPGTAVITGASAGLGLEFASALARAGFKPVLVARRAERLREIASRLEAAHRVRCEVFPADLAREEDLTGVAAALGRIDDLDVLVNNAGFGTVGYFADLPIEKSASMCRVHLDAAVRLTHAALGPMRQRNRGAVVNVASLAAFLPTPGNVVYGATKAFLVAFSENLRRELEGTGIRVQALCPGFTRTEFHEVGDLAGFDRSTIPDGLWMTAGEVVALSLKALRRDRRTIVIPGLKNRCGAWLIRHSGLVRRSLQKKVVRRDDPSGRMGLGRTGG